MNRRVDLPDILTIPPYQFVLFHPEEVVPAATEDAAHEDKPSKGKTREQIASRIRALFRTHPKPAKQAPTAPEPPAGSPEP